MNTKKQKSSSDKKWHWCMNYCKRKGLPPAQSFAWNLARDAYNSQNDNTILSNKQRKHKVSERIRISKL